MESDTDLKPIKLKQNIFHTTLQSNKTKYISSRVSLTTVSHIYVNTYVHYNFFLLSCSGVSIRTLVINSISTLFYKCLSPKIYVNISLASMICSYSSTFINNVCRYIVTFFFFFALLFLLSNIPPLFLFIRILFVFLTNVPTLKSKSTNEYCEHDYCTRK